MFLPILLLILKLFTVYGTKLGDSFDTFTIKHQFVDCYLESNTQEICEGKTKYERLPAWMRAEFENEKLNYLSYSIDADRKTADTFVEEFSKLYGPPRDTFDYANSSATVKIWEGDGYLKVEFSPREGNDLGHDNITISISTKRDTY
jgi:hypothetical protein